MPARLFAAGAIAVLMLTAGAQAADLYGDNYYQPREPYPYDDPRYADRDPYPPPGSYNGYRWEGPCEEDDDECNRPDRFTNGDHGPYYHGRDYDDYPGSIKDGYALPQPPPRYADRSYGIYGENCIPRWQIRHRLRAEGWRDLRSLEKDGGLATVSARRRHSGRVYTLRVDRCTGEVVDARPHYLRAYGAYDPRPWDRSSPY